MQPKSVTWRLFIALPLPEDWMEWLGRIRQDIGRLNRSIAIRWVQPHQMHLTLVFLGEVMADQVELLRTALAEYPDRVLPLVLQPGGLGCFPEVKRPRVIWVGVAGELDKLQQLQSWVSQATQAYGDHRENRAFQPHLTLGRIQSCDPQQAKSLAKCLQDYVVPPCSPWSVDHFILVRTILQPAGASHQILARMSLRPA